MEEKSGSSSGAVDTSGEGGAAEEQLLTVKHELRTGEQPRPLPAGQARGRAPEGTRVSVRVRGAGLDCRRGGRTRGGALQAGREPGGPGMWGRARREQAESFPEPGIERLGLSIGTHGAADSLVLALVCKEVFGPLSRTGDTSVTASCLG